MIDDYNEFVKQLHYLKDTMKDLGIESIDLNFGCNHVAEFTLNDAEAYNLIRSNIEPTIEDHYATFHLNGWARLGFVGSCDVVEQEYQIAKKETP